MAGKRTGLFGIYLNFTCLQKCVECLRAIGIRANDVAVLLAGPGSQDSNSRVRYGSEQGAPSFLGSTTRISLPASGVLTGTLINLGMPVYDAERYENRVQNGGVLVSVRCASPVWMDRVREILKQTGAEDISFSHDARAQIQSAYAEKPYAPQLAIGPNGALLTQPSSGVESSEG
ncbi:MAG: hypothetical protein ACHP8A_16285 [Terriglobales bacterium]